MQAERGGGDKDDEDRQTGAEPAKRGDGKDSLRKGGREGEREMRKRQTLG
jgi:hypothetical protein